MGEEMIKLTIHYGGEMKKVEDDYNYLHELGCKIVFWKLAEVGWMKFEDCCRSECVKAPISIIWFKDAREEMKMLQYVFDSSNFDMPELHSSAKSTGEIDVFIEHGCPDHLIGSVDGTSIMAEGMGENSHSFNPLVEVQPLRQPKTRKPRANSAVSSHPLPTTESTTIDQTSSAISSQPFQPNQLSSAVHASSSTPQPSVSSNKPKNKKRGRPLKTRKVENVPRGVGTFYSPFTGRPFQVFGDKVYDMSNNDHQPPL